jgi:hypothetical protein
MPVLKKNTRVKAGVVGLPAGIKDITRSDFRNEKWIQAIEGKGYRLAWSRTCQCPCVSLNDQTDQNDPNCPLCEGLGWIFFKPEAAVANPKIIGPLDEIQTKFVGDHAAIIHGIMTGISAKQNALDQMGPWMEGMSQLTVRAENKLGYYDRITALDSQIVYSQIIKRKEGTLLKTKYPVVQTNIVRDITKVYTEGSDFDVVVGDIIWKANKGPALETPIVVHYLTHPTFRVIEHPHAVRTTLSKFKIKQPLTPQGDPVDLPVQAVIRYEFLI